MSTSELRVGVGQATSAAHEAAGSGGAAQVGEDSEHPPVGVRINADAQLAAKCRVWSPTVIFRPSKTVR
jgi:hypothetical protein